MKIVEQRVYNFEKKRLNKRKGYIYTKLSKDGSYYDEGYAKNKEVVADWIKKYNHPPNVVQPTKFSKDGNHCIFHFYTSEKYLDFSDHITSNFYEIDEGNIGAWNYSDDSPNQKKVFTCHFSFGKIDRSLDAQYNLVAETEQEIKVFKEILYPSNSDCHIWVEPLKDEYEFHIYRYNTEKFK